MWFNLKFSSVKIEFQELIIKRNIIIQLYNIYYRGEGLKMNHKFNLMFQ